ncbi:hypothetical protein SAMN04488502_107170 [Dendrosporobacter quercicolus]|uniref:Uncharacterized protein n=1 Tax=Dendrosporobacter quercicolus TaxID=146817 RepID=A0A1G9WAU1_9FIRM|nr:hypothetical protein SAMN04488502_107170 [Dendrosporobacter quercicolus]
MLLGDIPSLEAYMHYLLKPVEPMILEKLIAADYHNRFKKILRSLNRTVNC